VPRARADVTNAAIENGNLNSFENLSRIDVDELAARDNQIGFDLSHRAANQSSQLFLGICHGHFVTRRFIRYQSLGGDRTLM